MSATVTHRYEFDDMRRFAAAIAAAAGLSPPRSLVLASHLLWFDAAGAAGLGIATLPKWIEAIDGGRIDPRATGRLLSERTAMAVLDGENGPAPLVLDRAGELAAEKAREAAVGLVRVVGVGLVPSAAPVAAGIAIGPMAGWVLGPERCWSLAVPTHGGLPMVVDPALADDGPNEKPARPKASRRDPTAPASTLLEGLSSAIESLLAAEGWLVAAVSVSALGPMTTDRERLAAVGRGLAPGAGRLLPEAWASHRRRVQQLGVAIEPAAWKSLTQWAGRLSVDVPEPLASQPTVDRS